MLDKSMNHSGENCCWLKGSFDIDIHQIFKAFNSWRFYDFFCLWRKRNVIKYAFHVRKFYFRRAKIEKLLGGMEPEPLILAYIVLTGFQRLRHFICLFVVGNKRNIEIAFCCVFFSGVFLCCLLSGAIGKVFRWARNVANYCTTKKNEMIFLCRYLEFQRRR